MEANFFERRKILKNTSMLNLTPFRKIEHKFEENGLVTLLYPKFKNTKFNKFMLGRRSLYINMKLDEIGTASWLLIDGKKNVGQIADELNEKLGEKIQPVHDRLGKFLSLLYNNKYISFKEIQKKEK
ncbi:MAG: PqqD family protein [Bacteroidales bacterium]